MRKKLLYVASAIILLFVAFAISGQFDFMMYGRGSFSQQTLLRDMWDAGDFLEVAAVADELLQNEPLHADYLLYSGLAHYYIANANIGVDDQYIHLDHSIGRLRKLLLLPQPPQLGNVYLILGKGYYHKGQIYYSQAIEYIERALSRGVENDEAYEYLGAAYAHLGDYDKSIAHLQRAMQISDSLSLKFALLDIYIDSGDIESADQLYRALRTDSLSNRDVQRLDLVEASLLIARQDYRGAVDKLDLFISEYAHVADAYFKLGEAYWYLSEIDRARYNWRMAIKLNPNHSTALQRLQG